MAIFIRRRDNRQNDGQHNDIMTLSITSLSIRHLNAECLAVARALVWAKASVLARANG
jgi:hypothetical protein